MRSSVNTFMAEQRHCVSYCCCNSALSGNGNEEMAFYPLWILFMHFNNRTLMNSLLSVITLTKSWLHFFFFFKSSFRNRQRKLGTKMQWCKISMFYLRARLVRISKERKINSNKNMSFENSLFFGRWSKASWDIRRQSRHPLWLQSVLI